MKHLFLAALLSLIAASAWAMWGGNTPPAAPSNPTLLSGGGVQLTCGGQNCSQ